MIRHRPGKERINTYQTKGSFSQEFHSFHNFEWENCFQRPLLRYKYESDLKQTEINPNRLQSYLLDSLWHNLQYIIKVEENNPLIQSFQPHMLSHVHMPPQSPHVVPNPPRLMETIFSLSNLPIVLHD